MSGPIAKQLLPRTRISSILAAQDVAEEPVPVVVAHGLGAQQPLHPNHQVGVGGLCDQVEMVAHQAIGMNLEPGFLAGLGQRLGKILPMETVTLGQPSLGFVAKLWFEDFGDMRGLDTTKPGHTLFP
jgi:hypothetical protein